MIENYRCNIVGLYFCKLIIADNKTEIELIKGFLNEVITKISRDSDLQYNLLYKNTGGVTMNINSVNSNDIIQQLLLGNLSSGVREKTNNTEKQFSQSTDVAEISLIGQLLQLLSQIGLNFNSEDSEQQNKIKDFFKTANEAIKSGNFSSEEQNKIKDFFKTVNEAIKSGNFDVNSLVEKAPEELKSVLEKNGIDIKDFLNNLNTLISERMGVYDNKMTNEMSIMDKIRNELGDGNNNEIKDFFKSVFESVKSGNFDVNALVEKAPEELKSFLEKNSIDIKDFLNNLNTEISKRASVLGNKMMIGMPFPPFNSDIE
jgi:uncharacterized protein (UPF0335 family)